MNTYTIEVIVDSYLISGPVRTGGAHGRIARQTHTDMKNLIFSLANSTRTATASIISEESGFKSSINFNIDTLNNGMILEANNGEAGARIKNYYADADALCAALEAHIDQSINPTPLS